MSDDNARGARFRLVEECLEMFANAMSLFIPAQLKKALGDEYYAAFAPARKPYGPWTAEEVLDHFVQRWIAVYSGSKLECGGFQGEDVKKLRDRVRTWRKRGLMSCADDELVDLRTMLRSMQALMAAVDAPDAARLLETIRSDAMKPLRASQRPTPTAAIDSVSESMEVEMDTRIDSISNSMLTSQNRPTASQGWSGTGNYLIVVDGSNVAWTYGLHKRYSRRGILIVNEYYSALGCRVVTFLPRTRMTATVEDFDDLEREALRNLEILHENGLLALIPPGDYDDAYLLNYARSHGGLVLSNDHFVDHLAQAQADGDQARAQLDDYLRHCRVSFSFLGDEFLPDPTLRLGESTERARQLASLQGGPW